MAFQTQASIYRGVGQVAQPAANDPIVAAAGGPGAFQVGTTGVGIGTFVFRSAVGSKLVTNVAPDATTTPVGFIQNLGQATILVGSNNSMTIPAGVEVSPKVAGTFWAVATTVATEGQKVFASSTDGTLSTGAAGATVTGSVETDWYVAQGAAVGDLIIISTWSKH